jgi:hypothetical protein
MRDFSLIQHYTLNLEKTEFSVDSTVDSMVKLGSTVTTYPADLTSFLFAPLSECPHKNS